LLLLLALLLWELNLSLSTTWRYLGGVEVQLHSFFASTLNGDKWPAWISGYFNSGYHRIRVCTFCRREKSLAPAEIPTPNRQSRRLVTIPTELSMSLLLLLLLLLLSRNSSVILVTLLRAGRTGRRFSTTCKGKIFATSGGHPAIWGGASSSPLNHI
jgi:hypothetical protein